MYNQSGFALVLGMIIITVLLIFVGGAVLLLNNEIHIGGYEEQKARAFYTAEAGLEYAASLLKSGEWDNAGNLKQSAIDKVTYSISGQLDSVSRQPANPVLTGAPLNITLISTGSYSGNSKTLSVTYKYTRNISNVFEHTLVGNGKIDIKNKVNVIGNNDGGNIYTMGEVITHNQTNIVNSEIFDLEAETIIPSIYEIIKGYMDDGSLSYFTNINNIKMGNSFRFDNDIVFINGNKTFKKKDPDISGSGMLVVDGDLTFNNGHNISNGDDEYLLIIVNGNVTLHNSTNFKGLIYATGDVNVKAKGEIQGTIISENQITVNNGNTSTVRYDKNYLSVFEDLGIPIPGSSNQGSSSYNLDIINWQE